MLAGWQMVDPERISGPLAADAENVSLHRRFKWYSSVSGTGAKSTKKCPRCGGEARRSHKHGFFQKAILRPLGIHPFRCRDCGNRFYRFSPHSTHHKHQTGSPAGFGQPSNKNGHFKEIIAQVQEKEGKLGLGKQDHHMTADELRRLHERAQEEELARDQADTRRVN